MRTIAELLRHEDYGGYLAATLELSRIVPNIDQIGNIAGYGFRMTGRWKEAYNAYLPGVLHGTVDCENYYGMALAAERLGKLSEASRLADLAMLFYPRLGPMGDELRTRINAMISIQRAGAAPDRKESRR
jgi:hypothetical protein